MDVLRQCCTVKVPAPPGQTVIDCKVHLEVIPDYAYQHSFPSHFHPPTPPTPPPPPPATTNLLLQEGRRLASIRGGGGTMRPGCAGVRTTSLSGAHCSRITVRAHGSEWCVGGRRTMSVVIRMLGKNSICRVWCCLFAAWSSRGGGGGGGGGIGFDDGDKRAWRADVDEIHPVLELYIWTELNTTLLSHTHTHTHTASAPNHESISRRSTRS